MSINEVVPVTPPADVITALATTLERLAARVCHDLDVDAGEGVPPDDPVWADTIAGVAAYAQECVGILDDPRVLAILTAEAGLQAEVNTHQAHPTRSRP